MAAITDLSDLVNRFTGGNSGTPEHIWFHKNARVGGAAAVATIAGRYTSLWTYEGSPSHGAAPTSTGAALDNTTQGGLKQTDPGGGRAKWLTGIDASASQAGTLILYDRLAHDGGFDATTTSAQTVSFTPPARYADGIGNVIWLEINTIIGTSLTTITVEYTDQGGTTGQVTQPVAFGATGLREVGRIIPVPLAAGDTGVRNITNVDLAASTTTAGDFAVVLAHPIAILPVAFGGLGTLRDFISGTPGIFEIQADACLALVWLANGVTPAEIMGALHMVEA